MTTMVVLYLKGTGHSLSYMKVQEDLSGPPKLKDLFDDQPLTIRRIDRTQPPATPNAIYPEVEVKLDANPDDIGVAIAPSSEPDGLRSSDNGLALAIGTDGVITGHTQLADDKFLSVAAGAGQKIEVKLIRGFNPSPNQVYLAVTYADGSGENMSQTFPIVPTDTSATAIFTAPKPGRAHALCFVPGCKIYASILDIVP